MKAILPIVFIMIVITVITIFSEQVFGEENNIPAWIKNNVKWWSEGKVSDSEFLNAMEYLINQNIIKVETYSASKTDSIMLPSISTDKKVYQIGQEIQISGAGFEYGTIGLLVNDDKFGAYIDGSQNVFTNSTISEFGDIIKYPLPDPSLDTGQWKKMNFGIYGSVLKSNVSVNNQGAWKLILKTSDLTNGHYEIRVAEKIYNGYDLLSNSSQTFLVKTAKTDFFIGSS